MGGLLLATYYVFNTKFAAATSMTYTALEILILGKASSKIVSSVANQVVCDTVGGQFT